ncbi:coiled-coil domain containing protein [Reticulomyxa filosa]|uniref:Coiled-coil domain containing protein n=1 Tax=Reticulomyxa filosa TaxID=46433 RepID=X6LSP8_RETFI|nr:coiled-coil domain containing protein [Reticulomyxa filosa]|eukprot:ETO04918.1 coiled-coil domain containing protein [Reticulomyxa filosa]
MISLGSASDKESISYHIKQVKWNRRDLSSEPNAYVKKLISMFAQIEKVLSSHPTLPKFIHHKLNAEAVIYVQEQLVVAFAEATKCTTEGRALMSLDQSELKKGLQQLKNAEPMPTFDYVTNFIQAFYLAEQDLLQWVEDHPVTLFFVHTSFSRVGRAAEAIKAKERNVLEQKIEEAYKTGKSKQNNKNQKCNSLFFFCYSWAVLIFLQKITSKITFLSWCKSPRCLGEKVNEKSGCQRITGNNFLATNKETKKKEGRKLFCPIKIKTKQKEEKKKKNYNKKQKFAPFA